MTHRTTLARANLVAGLGGVALVIASAVAWISPAPAQATAQGDGSDWGASGQLATDSAVTLRWDNVGNPAGTVVQRNQRQSLAHTTNKTYTSIASSVLTQYDTYFGAGNGLGGLSVTVSQTRDLVNQSIALDFSGVLPQRPAGSGFSNASFEVFQCWGAPGADGKPDPDSTTPDQSTCQVGATGSDTVGGSAKSESRIIAGDPLLAGGDWAPYDVTLGDNAYLPFRSITGETATGPAESNPFFNHTTTNELSHVVVGGNGTASRQFEVQTGSESNGLGCGARSDAPSTATCWLVIVPRIQSVMGSQGPLAPSVWAQRLQVQLNFQKVATSCPGSTARSLLGGSELLVRAAASWTAGVCDSASVSLGYSQYGDQVARNQYATGANDAILTTEPVPGQNEATYVPLALTAPAIVYSLDYKPTCSDGNAISQVTTEAGAASCGYASLAALRADLDKQGDPVTDLRLNARLVAKLLTQSYGYAIMQDRSTPAWVDDRPVTLFADPEFKALNPQLHMADVGPGGDTRAAATLLVETMRSDAAAQVWRWILADPGAASFLAGCPDTSGTVINPFYSSRTYTGCSDKRTQLEQAATVARAATPTPSTYVDQPVSYPPDGSPFPLPEWLYYTRNGEHVGATIYPMSETDWLPRVDTMPLTARAAFTGGKPANNVWCSTLGDLTCVPAPGKWTAGRKTAYGERSTLAISDTSSAARFQLPTAQLCDDVGTDCVEASTKSLRVASYRFTATSLEGVVQPGPADYADGAYPLTMPVYAVVRPTLPDADRNAYARAFTYITTDGQQQGYRSGALPPGYAPLTDNLTAQAGKAIADLKNGLPTTPTTPASDPSGSATTSPTAATVTSVDPGSVSVPDQGGSVDVAAAPSLPAGTPTPGALVPTAAGGESWPAVTLPLGLGIALLSGAIAPFLRTRTRWRIR